MLNNYTAPLQKIDFDELELASGGAFPLLGAFWLGMKAGATVGGLVSAGIVLGNWAWNHVDIP